MDKLDEQIDKFLSAKAFGVVGASDDPRKYGHRVFVCYLQNGKIAYPVNPKAKTVLGKESYPDVASLPKKVESISVITPPPVTEKVVDDAIKSGVKNIWMQPGAENASAVRKAQDAGLNVISGGPCLLVVMGYRE